MKYDSVKNIFAKIIDTFPIARKTFYVCLDMLLLRQRYVKQTIMKEFGNHQTLRFYDAGAGFGQYSYFMIE